MRDLRLGCTLGELYIRAIRRYPARLAVADDRQRLTFAAFGEKIGRYIAVFQNQGLKPGDRIAQLSFNSVDAISVIGAACVMGLAYVPLHPRGAKPDLGYVLKDSGVKAFVYNAEEFPDIGPELAEEAGVGIVFSFAKGSPHLALNDLAEQVEPAPLECPALPSDISVIPYTGGTTGEPKGVVHLHGSMVMNVLMSLSEWDWPEEIRFFAATPISHAAFTFILPVLLRGGTYYTCPVFSFDAFKELLDQERITCTFLVPSMIYSLLDQPEDALGDMDSLETIIYGAAPMSQARLIEAIKRWGPRFMQLYGQTEAPNTITALFKAQHDIADPDVLLSCGMPLTGVEVKLLDPQGQPVAQGKPGEICVRGPLIMDHYLNKPEATDEAFAGEWLHTGDVAYEDERGYLYIIDRMKDVIITGGFNVYPREIEETLMEHESVSQACVIGVPDQKWGEAVKAVVKLRDGCDGDEVALKAFVKERRGSVETPKSIDFADSIPLTPLGKADKKALRELYWKSEGRRV